MENMFIAQTNSQTNFNMSDSVKPIKRRRRMIRDIAVGLCWPSDDQKMENQDPDHVPEDSLMRLNDDCLRHIFKYSDEENLCELADVCTRARAIAEETFRKRYKTKLLRNFTFVEPIYRRILCKFGNFLTSLDVKECGCANRIFTQKHAEVMAKNCKGLEELKIFATTIYCDELKTVFSRVKTLAFDCSRFVGNRRALFTNCFNLKELQVFCNKFDMNFDFVAKKFPNLMHLDFFMLMRSDTAFDSFQKLMKLNPQLRQLSTTVMDAKYFSAIASHVKNLQDLHIGYRPTKPAKGLLNLSQLTKLKKLSFETWPLNEISPKQVAPLMTAFSREKVPIEHLHLCFYSYDSNDIKSIAKMKTLKTLKMLMSHLDSNDLVSLAKELPFLKELRIVYTQNFMATPATVLTALVNAGKNLDYIDLDGICYMEIDLYEFNELLKATSKRSNKNKLTIKLVGCKTPTVVDVPLDIQQENLNQLEILFECNCDCCQIE